jgi:hypothetical protein
MTADPDSPVMAHQSPPIPGIDWSITGYYLAT